MNRKRAAISVGLLSLLAAVAGGLALSLKHQPTFYRAALADSAPPEVRREKAREFVRTTLQLVDEIRHEDRWAHEFSEDAVNGWLTEELPVRYSELLPPDVAAPRVKFEKGMVRLAFQIRHGMWKGVVSGQVRPFVAGTNQLALEIESARIGLVPIPVDELLGEFVSKMKSSGWQLHWKNTGEHDVLVIDLDDDLAPESSAQRPFLEAIELEPGLLRISGRRMIDADDAARVADRVE